MRLKKKCEVTGRKTNRIWTQADFFSRNKLIEHSSDQSEADLIRPGGIIGKFSMLPIINTWKNSLDSYESLQISYQQLLKENFLLRSNQPVKSAGTSGDIPDHNLQSLALETEDLYSTLSDSHQSLQILLNSCGLILEESKDLQKKSSQLKFKKDLEDYTKAFKISLVIDRQLQETLRRVTEEVKWMKRERERVEEELKAAEAERKELEKEVKGKEGKVKSISGRVTAECLQVAELYYKLTAVSLSESKKRTN